MPNQDFLSYEAAVGALADAIDPVGICRQPNEGMSRLVMSARPVWILRNSTDYIGSVDAVSGKVHKHRG